MSADSVQHESAAFCGFLQISADFSRCRRISSEIVTEAHSSGRLPVAHLSSSRLATQAGHPGQPGAAQGPKCNPRSTQGQPRGSPEEAQPGPGAPQCLGSPVGPRWQRSSGLEGWRMASQNPKMYLEHKTNVFRTFVFSTI